MIQVIRQTFKSLLVKLRDPSVQEASRNSAAEELDQMRIESLEKMLVMYEKKFLLQERKIKTLTQGLERCRASKSKAIKGS